MKIHYILAIVATASLMQVSSACAQQDDYDNGYGAGKYNRERPGNDSSADYYHGYQPGEQERQNDERMKSYNNNENSSE